MKIASVLIVLGVLLACSWGFAPETRALAWHLRHGIRVEGAGLRLRVPFLYVATSGTESVVLMGERGSVRTRFGGKQGALMFISTKKTSNQNESVEQWWKRTSDAMVRQGAHISSGRNVNVGSMNVRCEEFEGGMFTLGVDIWCAPDSGALIIDYMGPRQQVDDFYSVLQSAQAVK